MVRHTDQTQFTKLSYVTFTIFKILSLVHVNQELGDVIYPAQCFTCNKTKVCWDRHDIRSFLVQHSVLTIVFFSLAGERRGVMIATESLIELRIGLNLYLLTTHPVSKLQFRGNKNHTAIKH